MLANILANPLRQLAAPMARHLAPSALVILSGLLTHQAPGVIAAYRARGLVPLRHLRIEGWSSLLLRKMNCENRLGQCCSRLRAITPFLPSALRLTRASDKTVQDLDDDAALLLVDNGRDRAAAAGGEIFSKVKAGIVHPLVIELRHSWKPPGHR